MEPTSVLNTEAGKLAPDNMEQMRPRYLVDFVKTRQLESVLAGKVTSSIKLREKLKETMPFEMANKTAQAEILTPVNLE